MLQIRKWVHIGLAKTGTTTLQRYIFSRHPEILYLGKNWIENDAAKEALIEITRKPAHRTKIAQSKAVFATMLESAALDTGKRISLLSEEDFTSYKFLDPAICASRIREIFPDANILVVIREPVQWLESMYYFRLSLRFPDTFDGFASWLCSSLNRPTVGTDIGQIKIGTTLKTYMALFGRDRIKVMLYEDFHENAEFFITTVCNELGIDAVIGRQLYHNEETANRVTKLRISKQQELYLRQYKLVMDGRYAEYVAAILPLIEMLDNKSRNKANSLIPADLSGDRCIIEERLWTLSRFVDKASRSILGQGERAAAEVDTALRERVRRIAEPEYRYVASAFGIATEHYFQPAGLVEPSDDCP